MALRLVTRRLGATVKPAQMMGLTGSYRQPSKAANALIAPVEEPQEVTTVNRKPWGVSWCGYADKWGDEDPPMVDWSEIATSFREWNQFKFPAGELLMGLTGVVGDIASSKLPGAK
eukprot:TRINITY_DN67330_c0_g1_i1.p1 TRINITY_DN67330_c0_g1~~TRINITY_DN67330_c0_g1_i1.p1  ORF type:complete len:116 (-),score=29.24 TRINITY_DN67330_c0_g1_i1:139-486(-)